MPKLFACVAALLLWFGTPAHAENKLAFVVGIDSYPHLGSDAQLARAVTDAEAVGDAFDGLGFKVTRLTHEATQDGILEAFDRFTRLIEAGDTVVFYYAGHGISLDDGNYLVPSDVPLLGPSDERVAKRHAIAEREIKQSLRAAGARVSMVVLDACRDNPFPAKGTRSLGGATRGLARIEAAEGVFSLYSAREGQTALDHLSHDDADRNSVFTRVFLKELKTPGVSLSELGDAVRDEVATLARADGHDQVPAVSNDLIGARSVFLAGRAAPSPAPMPVPAGPGPDEVAWSFIDTTTDPKQLEAFLARFPSSARRAQAEARLADLKRTQIAALPPPSRAADEVATREAAPDPSIAECDRLAAWSDDPTRPAGVAGVRVDTIDAAKAVPACRAALAARPADPRLKFQLAVALQKVIGFGSDPSPEVADLLRQSAEAGQASAMLILGYTHLLSKSGFKDEAEGWRWVRKAADLSLPVAFAVLGELHEHGTGVPSDTTEALRQYRKALAAGFADAGKDVDRLAKLVPSSPDIAPDQAVAECDRLAAWQDDPTRPAGVPGVDLDRIDPVKAIPACRAALTARPGDPRLKLQLATALQKRAGSRAQPSPEVVDLVRQSADAGHAAAMVFFAILRAETDGPFKDETDAVRWLRKAADAKLPIAFFALGYVYENGKGIAADKAEALRWYRKAAEGGYAPAKAKVDQLGALDAPLPRGDERVADAGAPGAADTCDKLAALSFDDSRPAGVAGHDVNALKADELRDAVPACRTALAARPDDPRLMLQLGVALGFSSKGNDKSALPEILDLFRRSAEAGNKAAMTLLAIVLVNGQAGAGHADEALGWLRKAAEGGVSLAAEGLGEFYEKGGSGVVKDASQARAWYARAAAAGDARAKAALDRLVAADAADAVATCDRRAAVSFDDTRPPGIAGHDYGSFNAEDLRGAVPACRAALAARVNDPRFMLQLGVALGFSSEGSDSAALTETLDLFLKSAQAGNKAAMTLFGITVFNRGGGGHGEALHWLEKAADGGVTLAATWLGEIYARGEFGVAQNESQARFYACLAKGHDAPAAGGGANRCEDLDPAHSPRAARLNPDPPATEPPASPDPGLGARDNGGRPAAASGKRGSPRRRTERGVR